MTIELQTVDLDLPALAAGFGRRLRAAGVPVTAERAARFADALAIVQPIARRRLYWTARAALVSDPSQVRVFDAVFREVFGSRVDGRNEAPPADVELAAADALPPTRERDPADSHLAQPRGIDVAAASDVRPRAGDPDEDASELPVPVVASSDERLWTKRFDLLDRGERAEIYRLMAELRIATPQRRTRRARRERRGERIDLRRTLRDSMHTGGDPLVLARRRRRVVPRQLVLLCDISGSMEPYARAYLHFLTSAAGSGAHVESFVFATRLTRVTRALATRSPEQAIQRAAAAAPDWSSGTRIGEALKAFNARHGRRGMARGAVIVILSDGWERGDPELVRREMERLARLAYRIVWVNPRASAPGFAPRTGGMAAALPHIDALVSGDTLAALSEVAAAISAQRSFEAPVTDAPPPGDDDEPWASATPVAGSSVAMPSGYGPSRGRTTPGWSSDR